MLFKNVASQGVYLYAYDVSAGAAKTGDAANITGSVSKDGAAAAATATANPTEIGGGVYWQPLSQAETNANSLAVYWASATANVRIAPAIISTDQGGVKLGSAGLDAVTVESGVNARQALAAIASAAVGDISAVDDTGKTYVVKGLGVATARLTVTPGFLVERSTALSLPA